MHPRLRSAALPILLWAGHAAAEPAADPTAHRRRITEIEERVAALKEEVFRHKSRLAALEATVLESDIAAAGARLVHRNEMGSSFRLEHVSYRLDGETIFERTDPSGALDDEVEIELWRDAIVPGDHTIAVVMVYRGDGFGVFSYLQSYVFTLRSSHTFHVDAGEQITVEIVGYEDGGVATDLTERPQVRFDDTLESPTRPGGG